MGIKKPSSLPPSSLVVPKGGRGRRHAVIWTRSKKEADLSHIHRADKIEAKKLCFPPFYLGRIILSLLLSSPAAVVAEKSGK